MAESRKSILSLIVASTLVLTLSACQKKETAVEDKGPAERAGEQLDRAAAQAGTELSKAAEKAGKGLQEFGQKLQDEAQKAQQDKQEK